MIGCKLRTGGNFWEGEVCGRCHRRNCVGFNVPDEIWEKVVQGEFVVLCTTCFDEMAEGKLVPYQFTGIWPVTWSDWRD